MTTGTNALNGFERKMMGPYDCSADACNNDHPERQRPTGAGAPCGPDMPCVSAACACPMANTDLDPLFTVMNRPGVTLDELSAVFNVTDFLLWQIVTVYTMNVDTGGHNSYIHGPTAGVPQSDANRLWRVINIDADWGYGYGWCCHDNYALPGISGTTRGCAPTDSRLTSFYCCGEMKMSELLTSIDGGRLYGRYLSLFKRFLQEDYAQECTIKSAVDQLLGPNGVLTTYLQADVDYWSLHHPNRRSHLQSWSLTHETTFM